MIKNNIIDKFTIDYEVNKHSKVHATVKIEPDFKDIKRIIKGLNQIEEIKNI